MYIVYSVSTAENLCYYFVLKNCVVVNKSRLKILASASEYLYGILEYYYIIEYSISRIIKINSFQKK